MRNLLTSVIKKTVNAKSTKLHNKLMLLKYVDDDMSNPDYNPKTARHKSLKEINMPGFKLN